MDTQRVLAYVRAFAERSAVLLRADLSFYLFIFAYALAGLLFLERVGASDQAAFAVYLWRWPLIFAVLLPAIALLADAFMLARRFHRRRSLAAKRLFSASRLAHLFAGVALLMAIGVLQGTYTSVKNGLPYWRGGFIYDKAQADIDAFIHFGADPWHYLFKIAGFDAARAAIEWNYNVFWFLICFGGLFFVATSPMAAAVRTRYLACFTAVWVLIGNVFAGIFLSAGPAFYGFVTGDTGRFADQLAFLARSGGSPDSAVEYQQYLWALHESGQAGFASGISAFPSVHVGLITLNALFLCEYGRKLGLVAIGYVLFVAASSVYLAWHYAIDGYASMAITGLIYFGVRKWAGLGGRRAEPLAKAGPVSIADDAILEPTRARTI